MQGVKGHVQNGTSAVAVSGYRGCVGLKSRSQCLPGENRKLFFWAVVVKTYTFLSRAHCCGEQKQNRAMSELVFPFCFQSSASLTSVAIFMEVKCCWVCPAKGDVNVARAAVSQWLPNNRDCSISKGGRVTQGMDTISTHRKVLKHAAMFSGILV